MKNISRTVVAVAVTAVIIPPLLMLVTVNATGQELSAIKPVTTESSQPTNKQNAVAVSDTADRSVTLFDSTRSNTALPFFPQTGDEDGWHMEIRPYLWAAGIYGRLRVRDTTVDTGTSSTDVLGMLDFAAAVQVEAKKNRWTIIFDENYVNLGTTATGPLGNNTIEVEPTLNLFEFGVSYEFARVANKESSANDPLPAVFSAEVLGGGRYVHFGLELDPGNAAAVEGSRNLVGVFIGNRVKVRPHQAVALIGKYTVGTSGGGSQFAWSADALVDLRLNKKFPWVEDNRWLGLNIDDTDNPTGFDGQLRGLIFTATIYH